MDAAVIPLGEVIAEGVVRCVEEEGFAGGLMTFLVFGYSLYDECGFSDHAEGVDFCRGFLFPSLIGEIINRVNRGN